MVYLFLANGFEEVEALTVLDYLRRCEEIEIKSVSVEGRMVTGSHKITVMADLLVDEVNPDEIEMIVLPGGMPGTLGLENSKKLQSILDYCASNNRFIGAICAAPSILGHKNLLQGKRAACYIGFENELLGAEVVQDPVVRDGFIITSRGAGTANQFAFSLIEALKGKERADKIKAAILWETLI